MSRPWNAHGVYGVGRCVPAVPMHADHIRNNNHAARGSGPLEAATLVRVNKHMRPTDPRRRPDPRPADPRRRPQLQVPVAVPSPGARVGSASFSGFGALGSSPAPRPVSPAHFDPDGFTIDRLNSEFKHDYKKHASGVCKLLNRSHSLLGEVSLTKTLKSPGGLASPTELLVHTDQVKAVKGCSMVLMKLPNWSVSVSHHRAPPICSLSSPRSNRLHTADQVGASNAAWSSFVRGSLFGSKGVAAARGSLPVVWVV